MLYALHCLIALALIESLWSVWGGLRLRSSFRAARAPASGRLKPTSLIIPCRGVDPGFTKNLEAFLQQDYPDFQVLFAVDSSDDPSVKCIEEARARFPATPSSVIVSGTAQGRSQKVHSQLRALDFLRPEDEAIAFGDSDIRPHQEWLTQLVSPLSDSAVGVSTGFRWYIPVKGNFASVLRSVWNAGIASLITGADARFAWGGAMAIRRETFESARVRDFWRNALSDDFAMTRAVREAGLRIRFEPRCLSLSYEDCSMSELLEWSFRQLAITRTYDPRLWKAAFAAQCLNFGALWGGLAAGIVHWGAPLGKLALAGAVAIYLLGALKAQLRISAVRSIFPEAASRHLLAYLFWGPLASVVSLAGLFRSAFSNEIEWRGIRYKMISPFETIVIGEADRSGGE